MVKKQLLYLLFLFISVFVLAEIGLRIYFSVQTGPRVLSYGTNEYRNIIDTSKQKAREKWREDHYTKENRTVELHKNYTGTYAKFFPNETKVDVDIDTGEVINVEINSQGFRGKDFTGKKPGVLRILTLGASSTFGFYNKDTTTYPYYLEQILNERCNRKHKFEVLNLGIPHLTSSQIAALFLSEGLELEPDIITVYSGNNDSLMPKPQTYQGNVLQPIYDELKNRLILIRFIDHLNIYESPKKYSAFDENYAMERSAVFLENLDLIYENAKSNGIHVVVANQQRKSNLLPRKKMKGLTYQDEVTILRNKHLNGEQLSNIDVSFLIHEQIMRDLEIWSQQHAVPLVDAISSIDQNRDYLLSWVHLHANANSMIASALADKILEYACPK